MQNAISCICLPLDRAAQVMGRRVAGRAAVACVSNIATLARI